MTRDLFDLLVELRPSSTSAGLEERIRRKYRATSSMQQLNALIELHLFEYKRRMLEYLEAVSTYESSNSSDSRTLGLGHYFNHGAAGGMTAGSGLQAFSEPDDQLGYDNKSISHEIITEVFVDFSTRTRQNESALYLKSLSGKYKTKYTNRLTHSLFVCQQYAVLSTTLSKRQTRPHSQTRTGKRQGRSRAGYSLC